jgi:hypothetical protein
MDSLTRGQEIRKHGGVYTKLQVCDCSPAGYYIGRMFRDDGGWIEPGSRESDYFPTRESAEAALLSGAFESRHAAENLALYEYSEAPTQDSDFPF